MCTFVRTRIYARYRSVPIAASTEESAKPKAPRAPNVYNEYLKKKLPAYKADHPGTNHKDAFAAVRIFVVLTSSPPSHPRFTSPTVALFSRSLSSGLTLPRTPNAVKKGQPEPRERSSPNRPRRRRLLLLLLPRPATKTRRPQMSTLTKLKVKHRSRKCLFPLDIDFAYTSLLVDLCKTRLPVVGSLCCLFLTTYLVIVGHVVISP